MKLGYNTGYWSAGPPEGVEKVVADSTMEEAAADSTMKEAAADSTMEEAAEEHEGHDH